MELAGLEPATSWRRGQHRRTETDEAEAARIVASAGGLPTTLAARHGPEAKPKEFGPRWETSRLHGAAVAADGDGHEDEEDAGDPGEALDDVGGCRGSEGERARRGGGDRDWLVFGEGLEPAGHRR